MPERVQENAGEEGARDLKQTLLYLYTCMYVCMYRENANISERNEDTAS